MQRIMRYEPLALWVLLVVLVIGSFSNVVAARQATTAVKNTDLIAQCTTPGTRCSKLAAESRDAQQKFFVDLITRTNRCLLESAFKAGATLTGEARIAAYDQCVARIPPGPTTTTSTTRGPG